MKFRTILRLIAVGALALSPLPVLAQGKPPSDQSAIQSSPWRQTEDRLLFAPASISLPRRVGAAVHTGTSEYSNQGEAIDNVVQYRSPDGEILVTVYIYYPALAHVGLASFATDQGIRVNSTSEVRTIGTQVSAAGGIPGAALRIDYANYRNGYASSAGFIKLGRWLIKLRVSAPEHRRVEVEAAMTSLLSDIRFEEVRPSPATPLQVSDCGPQSQQNAALLADNDSEIAAQVLIATAGLAAREPGGPAEILPGRVPPIWCLSSRAGTGRSPLPILRARDRQAGSVAGQSRLVAIINDAGFLLEVMELPDHSRFVVLIHKVGETALLGSYDRIPSDPQVAAIVSGSDQQAARVRARVRLRPGESDRITTN